MSLLEAIIADIVSLRSDVLRQTDKLLSQLNAEISSKHTVAKPVQRPLSFAGSVNITESNSMPVALPRYIPSPMADHHTTTASARINPDLKKSHLDLGIHWDDGDYKVASSGNKPTPIFSDNMKRSISRGFADASNNGDHHTKIKADRASGTAKGPHRTSKTQPNSANVSEASLTLLQQMVAGSTYNHNNHNNHNNDKDKKSGSEPSNSSVDLHKNNKNNKNRVAATTILASNNPRLSADDAPTHSPPNPQRRERRSKAKARPMSWAVGPSPSIQRNSDTESDDSQSKVWKSRTSTAATSKLGTPDLIPIMNTPQNQASNPQIECQDQIYDIAEVPTPPYMSPSDSVKKHFPVRESVQQNSGLQVVLTVDDQDKTASDMTEVKEEEKKVQDSEESLRRVMSGSKRTSPTISSKDDVLSWFKILCLVPAYDGKGRGLKFNDFNAADFQHVTFRHNGLHPRSYFISSWEFFVSLFYLIFAWVIPFTASYSNDFPSTPATNTELWSILITLVYVLDIIVVQLTPEPSTANELCNLMEYESLRPILPSWIYSNAYKRVPLDILATIPLELFVTSWERKSTLLLLHCFRFYRIPRILSTNAFYKQLRTVTDAAAGLPICNIIPITVGMFYFLHWNSCALYYFGSLKGFVGWSVVWPDIHDATLYEFYSWTFYQAVGNMFPINFT
ncbi:hypothetical protein BCR33DRAFT_335670 [Rhizoclosmatium globosum]|uniref:Ion transport domain-containing protein n=1 Tax=Rhizoclosmatium globosum TaxID=329046 RepID=A0A1Y2C3I1_9FUNG|nr:hypothetical protein BCR33DRAFT_335670 [Rhizoclosmatium globosum]|eukprot:ORY41578.1 hypothetical protein BCR33DRAFT_335670 [Rhizoclosmatium globosum]